MRYGPQPGSRARRRAWGWLLLLALAGAASAATITLWDERVIADVKITGAERGYLLYQQADGTAGKTRLQDVKGIRWDETASGRLTALAEVQLKKRSGRLLGVAVTAATERVREPLVRVFALVQGGRGERELRLLQNVRVQDPTRTQELPEIEGTAYRERYYFIELGAAIAFHVELWLDGQLCAQRDETPADLPAGWWRQAKLVGGGSLTALSAADLAATGWKPELGAAGAAPKLDCRIETVGLTPEAGKKNPTVKVKYSLASLSLDTTPLPAVLFHYVTEGPDGRREIQTLTCDNGGAAEPFVRGRLEHEASRALPAHVRQALLLTERDAPGLRRLVFWRLEIRLGERLLAAEEAPNRDGVKDLPAEWWK